MAIEPDIVIPELSVKQQLVLEYLENMDFENQFLSSLEPMAELPPFNEDREQFRALLTRYKSAFLAERPAFAMAIEETFSEEELRVQVEASRSPVWKAIQAKGPMLAQRMQGMMMRLFETMMA